MIWEWVLGGEMFATAALSVVSLVLVWLPFSRGLRLCFQARMATRHRALLAALQAATNDYME